MIKRQPESVHTLSANESIPENHKTIRANNRHKTTSKELTGEEISEAETQWIKSVQRASFPSEHKLLTAGSDQSSSTTYMRQFGLFFDSNGVIRCKRRIKVPLQRKNRSSNFKRNRTTFPYEP